MRLVFRLFELPMVAEGPTDAARPVMRCEFAMPESGWQEAAWVKQRPSGAAFLCVLWADMPDWQQEEQALAGWEPGAESPYVEVQPGLAVDQEGAEAIFE